MVMIAVGTGFLSSSCRQLGPDEAEMNKNNDSAALASGNSVAPIALHATLSMLEYYSADGEMLYEATYSSENATSPTMELLAPDGSKIKLHDDGTNGDKRAGDRVYSAILKQNKVNLKKFLQADNLNPM